MGDHEAHLTTKVFVMSNLSMDLTETLMYWSSDNVFFNFKVVDPSVERVVLLLHILYIEFIEMVGSLRSCMHCLFPIYWLYNVRSIFSPRLKESKWYYYALKGKYIFIYTHTGTRSGHIYSLYDGLLCVHNKNICIHINGISSYLKGPILISNVK